MFVYPIDIDYDLSPYYNNNRRRRYYNPQPCAYSYPSSQPFLSFQNPPSRHYPNPYHLHESYYDPENILNLVSGLNHNQNHNERHHNERFNNGRHQNERHNNGRYHNERQSEEKDYEKEKRKNGFRRVKIFGPEDEPIKNNHKNNNALTKQQAAKKIYNFLKYQPSTRRARKTLGRLLHLRNIQNQLISLSSQISNFETLTFTSKDAKKQILPISKSNKMFLTQEDAILRILDQLDKVQSEGNEIVRERRKEIVKIAQKILEELDAEKERQWKLFCDSTENSENIEKMDDEKEDIATENIEGDKKDIVIEEVTDKDIIEKMEDDKEEDVVNEEVNDEIINTSNEASEIEGIKPYTISSPDETNVENKVENVKNINTGDDEKDFDFIDDITSDSNSSINLNDEETVNVREPLIVAENTEESNEAALTEIKEKSQSDEQTILSPMEDVEDINKENDDAFVIVNNSSN
ncbi:26377_t:CDS:1 [Dentiscutata erythropus]|uniref:26377_t:CDS:1 n=1 Tax=Dentiscutata erythropus TaxID=1348616 RepID=A0A9N9GUT1_9GLOM|nr:26377_t:CDS:1 [Dentiscutata erythropus]